MVMQIFLEFANFYQRFIYGFLDIACFLFDVTESNSIFLTHSRQLLPLALASSDTLTSFHIKADSLNFVTEAVLPNVGI